jgi:hypothetical protein
VGSQYWIGNESLRLLVGSLAQLLAVALFAVTSRPRARVVGELTRPTAEPTRA